ncbi:MAG: HAD-IA family hydrolase [Gammaproteobacteria bacterium]|nr:HAD-IA family hydrolase [Gammaproteobacteria bacterium]
MQTQSLSNIDWSQIDTVLVDMDGTLLDLSFDTRFWTQILPEHIAATTLLEKEDARQKVRAHGERTLGTMQWYCLDHWTESMGVDIRAIKKPHAHLIRWLPGAELFLAALKKLKADRWLATNAHPYLLSLKHERLQIQAHFHRTVTAYDFNSPKESPEFWRALTSNFGLDLSRCVMIDDSIPVLRSAQTAGVGYSIEIMHPDSEFGKASSGRDEGHDFIEIDSVAEIAAAMERG